MDNEIKELSLEEYFTELDTIVEDMEQDEVSLEKSFELYEKGIGLLKKCNDMIDKVEKKVQLLDKEGKLHEF